jgi:ribonucleotide reductase beta subunit family protein with ferritin-like domain
MDPRFNTLPCDANLIPIPIPKERAMFEARYKAQTLKFWQEDVIIPNLPKDESDWEKITPDEQMLLKNILLFFSLSDRIADIIAAQGLAAYFKSIWISNMYTYHGFIETIHVRAYGKLLQIIFPTIDQLSAAQEHALSFKSIKAMVEWGAKYSTLDSRDPNYPIAEVLIACCIYEGILFTAWFAVIYHFKARSLFPALTMANEYIARDEGDHVYNHITTYNHALTGKLPQSKVHQMFSDGVELAINFLNEGMPINSTKAGLNKKDLVDHIKAYANEILTELGYSILYTGRLNKIDMSLKDSAARTSLHEATGTTYQTAISDPSKLIWPDAN